MSETGEMADEADCKGQATEVAQCGQLPACPVMMPWSQWSMCSSNCGQGVQTRNRRCTIEGACMNEMPYEEKQCMNSGCLSDWTEWATCDKMCGGGRSSRQRVCLELDPSLCRGELTQNKLCNTQFCENWGSFEAVGPCTNSQGCGRGVQNFKRTCIGGSQGAPGCQGSDSQQSTCSLPACPSWSAWSQYGQCENKVRTRTRSCVNGLAGQDCQGNAVETKACWSYSDNNWSQWGAWGACQGNRQRYRQRTCPNMGSCYGAASENQNCGQQVNSWSFGNFANSFFGRK